MVESSWSVRAAEVNEASLGGRRSQDLGHWGCLAPMVTAVLTFLFMLIPSVDFSWYLLIPSSLGVCALIYLDRLRQLRLIEKEYQAKLRMHVESLGREARYAEEYALVHLRNGEAQQLALRHHLESAGRALDLAGREFESRAFGPFWDAVEAAALSLGQYRHEVSCLAIEASSYYRQLKGRENTFPDWQEVLGPVADPQHVVSQFQAQVRRGQTDYQFAEILEHRLTRQVLIAGFKHFGDALGGLGRSVQTTLDQVVRTLEDLRRGG